MMEKVESGLMVGMGIREKVQSTKPACLKWNCLKSNIMRSQAGTKEKVKSLPS